MNVTRGRSAVPRNRAHGLQGLGWRADCGVGRHVNSHVETLLERLTGSDKVRPDEDGGYQLRFRSAHYYVRVVAPKRPVVIIQSIAAVGVEMSDELARALNDINVHVSFCRAFWDDGRVVFESEHLGSTVDLPDFTERVEQAAGASGHYGPQLVERFGGQLLNHNQPEPANTGFYL